MHDLLMVLFSIAPDTDGVARGMELLQAYGDSCAQEAREKALETLVDAQMNAHGSGQQSTIDDVNAGRIDDMIAPRLAEAAREARLEERERCAKALAWLKERADWLDSEVRHGGTCYIERDQALYAYDKLRGILEADDHGER